LHKKIHNYYDSIMKCIICQKLLTGKQSKFCSQYCKIKGQSNTLYSNQQVRGHARKDNLVTLKGGKCQVCGYSKCMRALTFHHRTPKDKLFSLDIRCCSNRKWESLLNEANKCDLLCFNCHMELHDKE
jgi:hypothetical protein